MSEPAPGELEAHADALVAEAAALLERSASLERPPAYSPSGELCGDGWSAGLFTREVEGLHTPQHGFANYDALAACEQSAGAQEVPALCALRPSFGTRSYSRRSPAAIVSFSRVG